MTTNYGIIGGQLDATKHLEAAIPRMLNAAEQASYRDAILPPPAPRVPRDWRAN